MYTKQKLLKPYWATNVFYFLCTWGVIIHCCAMASSDIVQCFWHRSTLLWLDCQLGKLWHTISSYPQGSCTLQHPECTVHWNARWTYRRKNISNIRHKVTLKHELKNSDTLLISFTNLTCCHLHTNTHTILSLVPPNPLTGLRYAPLSEVFIYWVSWVGFTSHDLSPSSCTALFWHRWF